MSEALNFQSHAREIRRALLVTAAFERQLPDGGFKSVRLSDQMRRLLELVNELSFGAEPPSEFALFRSRVAIGRALSMDEKDVRVALEKAEEFEILKVEERGDGFLRIELRAAKLAVAGRALVARAAIDEIEIAQRERVQQMQLQIDLPGCERSHGQARDFGLSSALDEVAGEADREHLAALAKSGRFPDVKRDTVGEIPRRESRHPQPRAYARTDSEESVPSTLPEFDSNARARIGSEDSGAVAAERGSDLSALDSRAHHLFKELEELDTKHDLQVTQCRRTWVNRLIVEPIAIDRAIADVRDEQRRGLPHTSPLGLIFSKARTIARKLGRELRSVFFTA